MIRPAGIRHCGVCGKDADHGQGQSACKNCRATAARTRRAAFNAGVKALRDLTLG